MVKPVVLLLLSALHLAFAGVVNFEAAGAVAEDSKAAATNTQVLNQVLSDLAAGDTLYIANKTFWVAGGVRGVGLTDVTIQLDGTLQFLAGRKGWPTFEHDQCGERNPLQPPPKGDTCVQEAFFLSNVSNIRLTSNGSGTLQGNGKSWWGYINYLRYGEDRPRLLSILNGTDISLEHWRFIESPYWTFTALDVARVEIHHCAIINRVNDADSHGVTNLDAFNTDGFDIAGKDIYIHDCYVWNQDDCFTIQPLDSSAHNAQCTENVLIEDVEASGLGLTVGAVKPSRGHNCVRNVTFRRAHMHHTFKGIYVKSQNTNDSLATGEITDILYEDIYMEEPSQVPIWIGPAQEADSYEACSLVWPEVPLAKCPPPPETMKFTNITLRNVTIQSPKQSPGVIFGNASSPFQNVVFDKVVVEQPGKKPWGDAFYKCEGVSGVAVGGTSPIPPCFKNATSV